MKKATSLLFTALLLTLASVAGAADVPAAAPAAEAAPLAALDSAPIPSAFTAPAAASECGRASVSSPFLTVAWEKGADGLAPNSCGACSTPNCNGALRGQMCWLGGIQGGWGHCNIYSGGYRCDTGGWECQCGVGPLP